MPAEPATCHSTRNAVGCGHPVTDHDGKPARECCCCNRQHNHPAHVADCLDCQIRRIKKSHPGVPSNVAAELLPEHLREPFWQRQIERYLAEQGDEPTTSDRLTAEEQS